MVDPIDWSHPPPYTGQYPLSSTYCTVQCGLQITRLTALTEMRTCDLRNARPMHCLCGHSGYKQFSALIIAQCNIIKNNYNIMLICHKLVVSNEVEVLQACHVSDVHATSAVYAMPASWEVVCCWASHPVLSITSDFSNTITLQQCLTTTTIGRRSCHTDENCMHAEQIIIILYIYIYVFFFVLCICCL